MRPEDLERERASFALLQALHGEEAVLVGGYAVSAYGPPRFSVDLDLVVRASAVSRIRKILKGAGFARVRRWQGGGAFAGRAERWTRGNGPFPLSVDLFVGGISDRVSGAAHSFEEIRRRARTRTVRGLDPASVARTLVPAPEVLIGLKLESARSVDLRDLAILAGGSWDLGEIVAFLGGVPQGVLLDHTGALLKALERRDFRDSLKGVYMLDERAFEGYAERTRALALGLRQKLSRPVKGRV